MAHNTSKSIASSLSALIHAELERFHAERALKRDRRWIKEVVAVDQNTADTNNSSLTAAPGRR